MADFKHIVVNGKIWETLNNMRIKYNKSFSEIIYELLPKNPEEYKKEKINNIFINAQDELPEYKELLELLRILFIKIVRQENQEDAMNEAIQKINEAIKCINSMN
ncbi:MAG: hypothetical protein QW519_04390 [Candidatus Thermoplasmatota archaeon]